MKKIIHIGLSKSFSTSIQRSFFFNNSDIFYLGVGYNNNNIDYISYKIQNLFEFSLRYEKKICFLKDLKKYQKLIKKYISLGKRKKKKAIAFSVDTLSIKLNPHDIDTYEKYFRLKMLFGSDLKIILIIRNQIDQLKSIYRESVKLGYHETFNEYISRLLKYQKNFYLNDFFYDDQYLSLIQHFKKKNILILQNENYYNFRKKLHSENLSKDIFDFLKIKEGKFKLKHYNKTLSDYVLERKRLENKKYSHDISNFTFEISEAHRLKNYFTKELKLSHIYKNPFKDVITKNKILNKVKKNTNISKKLSYNISIKNKKILLQLISKSNKNFEKLSGIKLNNKFFT